MFFAFDGNSGGTLASVTSGIVDDDSVFLSSLKSMAKAAGTVSAFMRLSTEAKYPLD